MLQESRRIICGFEAANSKVSGGISRGAGEGYDGDERRPDSDDDLVGGGGIKDGGGDKDNESADNEKVILSILVMWSFLNSRSMIRCGNLRKPWWYI